MQRRAFIKDTAFCAVAISTMGSVHFNGKNFEGDCETTTDILGPFYRPDAPVRSDLRIKNATGQNVILSGQIKHKDCTTALKNACIEIWHCDGQGVYDNDSSEFKYRAKTYSDNNGNYSFKTIIPVPYDIGNGTTRPAHFHMLISAPGYQSLITQLYFTGDAHLSKDPSSSSPAAKRRILDITNGMDGEKAISFNVTMREKLPADVAVIDRLAGTYTRSDNKEKKEELYKRDGMLWIKDKTSINGGYPLEYSGNNTFEYYGLQTKYEFILQSDGTIKLSYNGVDWGNNKIAWIAVKPKN